MNMNRQNRNEIKSIDSIYGILVRAIGNVLISDGFFIGCRKQINSWF